MKKIKFPLLYLITDRCQCANIKDFFYVLETAVKAGIDVIQLREKHISSKELFEFAKYIRKITIGTNTLFIVNNRIDIMLASEADGVHLGWQSLPVETARKLAGHDKIIGISLHSLEEFKNIKSDIDYIILSPIFHTPSKEKILTPLGLSTLKEAATVSPIPIIALGGIDKFNIKEIFDSGASGAGFIRAVFKAENIKEHIYKLKSLMKNSYTSEKAKS